MVLPRADIPRVCWKLQMKLVTKMQLCLKILNVQKFIHHHWYFTIDISILAVADNLYLRDYSNSETDVSFFEKGPFVRISTGEKTTVVRKICLCWPWFLDNKSLRVSSERLKRFILGNKAPEKVADSVKREERKIRANLRLMCILYNQNLREVHLVIYKVQPKEV